MILKPLIEFYTKIPQQNDTALHNYTLHDTNFINFTVINIHILTFTFLIIDY